MSTFVTRVYENPETAKTAVASLRQAGFDEDSLHVYDRTRIDDAQRKLEDAAVDESDIATYRSALDDGKNLLAFRAPFGMAGKAVTTLRKTDSVDIGIERSETHVGYELSDNGELSIIPGNRKFLTSERAVKNATSRVTPAPYLTDRQRGKAKVGSWTVTGDRSKLIKQPKRRNNLLRNPTPFSSLLGLKTIIEPKQRDAALTDNPTPFSSFFGWPTILRPYDRRRSPANPAEENEAAPA